MKFEVDQSGRIEETNRATVIALANKEKRFTLFIPAKVKRQLKEYFRRQGKPRIFPVIIFAVVVSILLVKSRFRITNLIIDIEYPGHEKTIISIIKQFMTTDLNIYFQPIGKKSHAHYVAYGVFIGRKKPNGKLNFKDIIDRLKK